MTILRDPDGGLSKTLLMVIPAVVVLLFKFAIAGMAYNGMVAPPMSAGEFGAAFALVVGVWVAREAKEAHYANKPKE